jgi:hypothetical protein
VLDRVLDENDDLSELIAGRIVNIFYLFSQAENYVKEVVADRVVLKRMGIPYLNFSVLTFSRCIEGSSTNDTITPNHDAEIH